MTKPEDEVESLADSTCFLSNGKRKMMRIFVAYEENRVPMDIPHGKTVSTVKKLVQDRFFIQPNSAQLGDENQERNILVLNYAGAEMADHWVISDMGISPGATIRVAIKEELDPVFHFYVTYTNDSIPILDRVRIRDYPVANVRSMASKRTGLPVSVFRLISKDGLEMFDYHTLDKYNIRPGDVIKVETWDGWDDFLNLAALGFTSHVIGKISSSDEILARFQMKVALYMAAHFGHVDLAVTLTKQGIRSDEPVGEHPLRQWNQINRHVDHKKCPVHEAVESGQLTVLRSFVHSNVCCVMARDGNNLQPINIALRNRMKACASFLLTKQWSRVPYNSNSIPLAIFARMKSWTDRAKDKVQLFLGSGAASGSGEKMVRRKVHRENPLVGQGVYLDGYSPPVITKKQKHGKWDPKIAILDDYYRSVYHEEPEHFFRSLTSIKIRPSKHGSRTRQASHKTHNTDETPVEAGQGHQEQEILSSEEAVTRAMKKVSLPAINTKSTAMPQNLNKRTSRAGEDVSCLSSATRSTTVVDAAQESKKTNKKQTGDPPVTNAASAMSASILAKAKGADASIPLPLTSIDDTPRPYFFVGLGKPNIPRETLQLYERYRGVKARDYAIQCMSVASNFKEKAWLFQVRMAMNFAEHGVRKPIKSKSGSMFARGEGASVS